jgi:hypothetical protein
MKREKTFERCIHSIRRSYIVFFLFGTRLLNGLDQFQRVKKETATSLSIETRQNDEKNAL